MVAGDRLVKKLYAFLKVCLVAFVPIESALQV